MALQNSIMKASEPQKNNNNNNMVGCSESTKISHASTQRMPSRQEEMASHLGIDGPQLSESVKKDNSNSS